MIEYTLRMTSEQAHTANRAIELLMRLKLGQYEELPFSLIDLSRKDFCERRDRAKTHLKEAFDAMLGSPANIGALKDEEWYRLYNLHQALRYMIHEAEHPGSVGVDSYPPTPFTTEPLPGFEWRERDD